MVEFIGEIVQIVFFLQVEIVYRGTLRRGISQVYFRMLRVSNMFFDEFVEPVAIPCERMGITHQTHTRVVSLNRNASRSQGK